MPYTTIRFGLTYDVFVVSGDTYDGSRAIRFVTEKDVTGATAIVFTARRRDTDTVYALLKEMTAFPDSPIVVVDASTGTIDLNLVPADTISMYDVYEWDLQVTQLGGSTETQMFGSFTVKRGLTP